MIKQLKSQIESILRNFPHTRNSDFELKWQLWESFYPEKVEGGMVTKESERDLPSQDNIKRIRAMIQNSEKKFLPTSWEVAKERRWLASEWKSHLGYSTPIQVESKMMTHNFNKTSKQGELWKGEMT